MSNFSFFFAKLFFGKNSRIRVYRQLERLIRNGVKTSIALDTLYNRASKDGKKPTGNLAIIFNEWRKSYQNGEQLGDVVKGWVPESEQMLIEAGEKSGEVPNALKNVIQITQTNGKIKSAIIGGLIYPIILLLVIIGMMWGFKLQIVPAFSQIIPAEQWTGSAKSVYDTATFIYDWSIPILIAVGVLITLYISTISIWTGEIRRIFDKIPPWSMYRLWQGSSFMLSLAALLRAGVPVSDGLKTIRRNASPYLAERIDRTLFHYNTGAHFGEALYRTKFQFPEKEIVEDMRVYSTLPKFEEVMQTITNEWLENSIEMVQAQAKTINYVMLFLMAGTISWLGVGLFEIQQQVTAGASAY